MRPGDKWFGLYISLRVLSLILPWVIVFNTCGCAAEHGRIEGPPLYVHLCDAMPAADKEAWGTAAGDINLELGEPVLWVGHGPPVGCDTVDVCPGAPRLEIGECVVRVRYVDSAGARQAYESILEAL